MPRWWSCWRERCGVPRSAVTLSAGQTSRIKTLEIVGDADALGKALAALYG